jgi:hypothetical protein
MADNIEAVARMRVEQVQYVVARLVKATGMHLRAQPR